MSTIPRHQGFTLVEVLAVMLVLVAIATITVEATSQLAFDGRYQITQDRYDKIKTAILGNPNQTINGHPSVSGFVADMGRLPNNLRELLDNSAGNMPHWGIYGLCTDSSATPPTVTPTLLTNCQPPLNWVSLGIGAGWRGTYIETPNDPAKNNAITDGWGNLGNTNDGNYGWGFSPTTDDLTIKSYGKDGIPDTNYPPPVNGICTTGVLNSSSTCTVDAYNNDYPQNTLPIVSATNWTSSESIVNVTITPPMNLNAVPRPTDSTSCTTYGGKWTATDNPPCAMPAEYTQSTCPTTWHTGGYCSNLILSTSPICGTTNHWTSGSCSNSILTTQSACETQNTWIVSGSCSDSVSTNETDCTAASAIWTSNNYCSNPVLTAQGQSICETLNTWTSSVCSNTSLLTQLDCEATNIWTTVGCDVIQSTKVPSSKLIYLRMYYHDTNGQIKLLTGINPSTIWENGTTQTIQFQLPVGTVLRMGQAAFTITTDAAGNTPYPNPTTHAPNAKIVDIFPNRSLNFDW